MTTCPPGDADVSAASLGDQLVQFVRRGLEDFATHAAPGLTLPGSYGGHAIGDETRADLLYVLGLLHQSGVGEAAGVDLWARAVSLLDDITPARVDGFYSYRIAETVLRLGGLAELSADRSATALAAARSPRLVAALLERSPQLRTNYLVVGARCLWAWAALQGREPAELPPILGRVADLSPHRRVGGSTTAGNPGLSTTSTARTCTCWPSHLPPGWDLDGRPASER